MADLQGINPAALLCAAESTVHQTKVTAPRFDAGVCLMPRQASGRALLSRAVLRYKRFPAALRWVLPRVAALLALTLYWLVRFLPYWLSH